MFTIVSAVLLVVGVIGGTMSMSDGQTDGQDAFVVGEGVVTAQAIQPAE